MRTVFTLLLLIGAVQVTYAQMRPYRGWYAGFQGGLTDTDTGDNETAIGIHGGFQFNRFFAVECGLLDMSDLDFQLNDEARSELDVYGLRTMAIGMLPISERVSLTLASGFFHHRAREDIFEDEWIRDNDDETVGFLWEAGVHFPISDEWSLRITGGRYDLDPYDLVIDYDYGIIRVDFEDKDIRLYTASFSYRF